MRYLIPILLIASLAHSASPQPRPESAPDQPAGFSGAQFRKAATIDWPAELPPPDFKAIVTAITEAISSAATANLPGVSLDELKSRTRIHHAWMRGNLSDSSYRGRELSIMLLEGNTPLKPDAANAYLSALMDRARDVLIAQYKQRHDEMLDRPAKAMQIAEDHLHAARAKADSIRAEIRQATGRVEVSPEILHATISSLDTDKQHMSLELAGLSVRRKMLQEGIAKFGHDADKAVDDDAIVKELNKIIEARHREVARLHQLVGQGAVSQGELSKAEAELAEAQVRILERKEQATRAAGGEALADLNKELLTVSVNAADAEARLQFIDASLKRYAAIVSSIDELERAIRDLQRAEADADAAKRTLHQVEKLAQAMQPPALN